MNMRTLVAGGFALGAAALASAEIHVSPAGSDANTGESWAQALATISAAVTRAGTGGTILVSNGVYGVGAEIVVTNAITLTGVGGGETLVQRTSGSTRIFRIGHADAALDGFTVARGEAPSTDLRGAGVLLTAGTVRNCVISNNVSELKTSGAGIYMTGGLLTNSVIRDNHCKDGPGGAGVYMAGGVMAGCRILDNGKSGYRAHNGTGLHMLSGSLAVDCVIAGNKGIASTFQKGGGAYVNGGVLKRCTVTNNVVNDASSEGGGVYLLSGSVENCLIAYNRCTDFDSFGGGGVALYGGSLLQCTVVGNQTSFGLPAGGLDVSAGVQWNNGGVVSNCIVFHNTRLGSQGQRNIGGHPGYTNAFRFSCAPELAAGVNGNLSDEPLFANRAQGDFRLRPDSPCLDAGAPLLAEDRAGAARPQDGDGDGAAASDVGAFERADANSAFSCHFQSATNEAFQTLNTVFTARVFGPDTNGLSYRWDFGNGTQEGAGLAQVSRSYTTGFYGVSLTVSNASGETASWSLPDCIRVGVPVAHVAAQGAHQFPFDTWATASTSILAAVQSAVVTPAGATRVVVSNGTYAVPSSAASIFINRGITVESLAGAAATLVSGVAGADVYPNFELDHPDAVVEGFTSRNANFGAMVNRGTLRRCILRENAGDSLRGSDSGFGAGIRMFGGLVEECQILTNTISGNTGICGAGLCVTGPSLVRDCVIAANRIFPKLATSGGGVRCDDLLNRPVLRNCLVFNNKVDGGASAIYPGKGGGVYLNGGRVENCTVTSNAVTGALVPGASGGGLYCVLGGVTNTIVFNNTSKSNTLEAVADDLEPSNPSAVAYSCAPELTPGARGNLAADPLFVDFAGRDFRLQPDSPCCNAGTKLEWTATGRDLDGRPRLSGSRVDMGAYESSVLRGTLLRLH